MNSNSNIGGIAVIDATDLYRYGISVSSIGKIQGSNYVINQDKNRKTANVKTDHFPIEVRVIVRGMSSQSTSCSLRLKDESTRLHIPPGKTSKLNFKMPLLSIFGRKDANNLVMNIIIRFAYNADLTIQTQLDYPIQLVNGQKMVKNNSDKLKQQCDLVVNTLSNSIKIEPPSSTEHNNPKYNNPKTVSEIRFCPAIILR